MNGNGWRGWALGVAVLIIGGLSALVINELVLSGIAENKAHTRLPMHSGSEVKFAALEGNLSALHAKQEENARLIKVVIRQMILTQGELAEGPVPPELMDEILNGH